MALALSTLWLATAAGGDEQAPLRIDKFVSKEVAIRDAEGQFVGTRPAKAFGKPPIEIRDLNRAAVQVLDKEGKAVWVDRIDVKLNHSGSVQELCKTLAMADSPDRTKAATMGVASACSK